ncbi:MAG: aromatic ring-hydroxylating dioxygenase subunit alpha [Novosphingobium sp.]|nr:aromatic ring-hydroxylating dioxygenase subunit alpha [Novosphingobium sp.]
MNEPKPVFEPQSNEELAWLGTDPIPASAYHDPAYYELEREAVFKRSWLPIGHVCELAEPGSFIRRDIEVVKASLLIARGKEGEVRAFHNVCPHRGTRLVPEVSGTQATFSCRYHAWTFGLDGGLISAPDFERFYVKKEQCGLKPVAVEVFAGLIFIHFGSPEQSVRDWLGDLAEPFEQLPIAKATQFVEYSYEIGANWKLTFDNFQENYHLRVVHPRTGGPGCAEPNPFAYPERYNFWGPHRSQTIWNNPNLPAPQGVQAIGNGRIVDAAGRAGLFGAELGMDFTCLFPNFTVFGPPARQFTQTVWPLGPNRSRGIVRFYWVGEEENASERFAREYVMASQRDIHCEDRDVIEAGQAGLASGAIDHINFQGQEVLCRHLFEAVDAMVAAWRSNNGG